ncbi:MAG: hypothetical protein EOO06_20600 [Chitinophagaceae bacterium]|nr:MAG: hypothetical protein EOO06_20600 [Chitinophagaceae bacterium]
MAKRRSTIAAIILLLLLAGAAVGYYFYNKGPVNIQNASATEIDAATLYTLFLTDSTAAQNKYSGKILAISGIVAQSTVNQAGLPVILLQTPSGDGFVNCSLQAKDDRLITPGDPISIKGICSGLGQGDEELGLQPDLYLERCIIQP